VGTTLGLVRIGIILKQRLVLLQGLDSWQHAGHRPVSFGVVISFARTTITEDDRPLFLRFRFGIYRGMFPIRSWRTPGYFRRLTLNVGRT
jgi:hypothetical protein